MNSKVIAAIIAILFAGLASAADCGDTCDNGFVDCSASCSGSGPLGIHKCVDSCRVKLNSCVKKACPAPEPKPEPKPTPAPKSHDASNQSLDQALRISELYRKMNIRVEGTDQQSAPDICRICLNPRPGQPKPRACTMIMCETTTKESTSVRKFFQLDDLAKLGQQNSAPPIANVCTFCKNNPGSPICFRINCGNSIFSPVQPNMSPTAMTVYKYELAKMRDFAKLLNDAGQISRSEFQMFDKAATKDFRSIRSATSPAR